MFEPSALTTPGTRSQPALENLRGARAGKVSEYVVRPGASDSSLTMTAPRELALSAEGLRAAARSCAQVCVCVCVCVRVCVCVCMYVCMYVYIYIYYIYRYIL